MENSYSTTFNKLGNDTYYLHNNPLPKNLKTLDFKKIEDSSLSINGPNTK